MLRKLGERIERRLYAKGFRQPEIRAILRMQILLCGASTLAGVLAIQASLWPIGFAVGVNLATYSVFSLARFLQRAILQGFSRQMLTELLLRFYGRLFVVGIILYGLMTMSDVPSSALVAGLATCMATMLVGILFRRAERKIKEA